MNPRDFFAELKRRNVYKVAVAYVVAAWLLIQVATQVFPFFEIPNWAVRLVVLLSILGFPITLVLAWAFEITPEGIKREEDLTPNESIRPRAGRKLVGITIALAVMAAGLFVYQVWPPRAGAKTAPENAPAPVASAVSAVAIPKKSIAVLPFENLSADKDNAYFASGMQDMVLTKLAGIGDLKVISRTSTEKYASHPDDLKAIARQLGVAAILEGSVQKSGNQVLINVQLIDAASDNHLWAEAYPRTLDNIFGVEGEVAQKVADALKAKLTPAESARIAHKPTQNAAAYDLYLRANAHYQRAYEQVVLVPTEMPLAIALYQQALAKDPGFALAAAMLAQAHMVTYWQLPDRSETRLAAAKLAVDRALALQSDLGEAHEALGMYWYYGYLDYNKALQQLDIARKALPNSASVEIYVGNIQRRQGHWNEAIASYQRAIALDPRSSESIDVLADAYLSLRRYADADQAYARAVALARDPVDEKVKQGINTVLWKGDLAPLRAALGSLTAGNDDYSGNASSSFQLAWWSRDYPAAARIAQTDTAANWSLYSNDELPSQLFAAWAYQAAGASSKAQALYAALRPRIQAALLQRPDDANLHLALGFSAAGLGLKDEAIREGRKAVSLMPLSRDAYTAQTYVTYLAQLYVRVGENGQAIDTLRQALAMPSGGSAISPALLKLDPIWDPLRHDPAFQALLAKYAEDGKHAVK